MRLVSWSRLGMRRVIHFDDQLRRVRAEIGVIGPRDLMTKLRLGKRLAERPAPSGPVATCRGSGTV